MDPDPNLLFTNQLVKIGTVPTFTKQLVGIGTVPTITEQNLSESGFGQNLSESGSNTMYI
jgi:hypothetical protein